MYTNGQAERQHSFCKKKEKDKFRNSLASHPDVSEHLMMSGDALEGQFLLLWMLKDETLLLPAKMCQKMTNTEVPIYHCRVTVFVFSSNAVINLDCSVFLISLVRRDGLYPRCS